MCSIAIVLITSLACASQGYELKREVEGKSSQTSGECVTPLDDEGSASGHSMLQNVGGHQHSAVAQLHRFEGTAISDYSDIGMGVCKSDDGTHSDIGWSSSTCPTYPCTAAMPTTVEQCAVDCNSNTECAAFSYYKDHCWLYSAPGGGTYTKTSSDYSWYECYVKTPTTTTTTTVTTTTTTITTTTPGPKYMLMRNAWRCPYDSPFPPTRPEVIKLQIDDPAECEKATRESGFGYFSFESAITADPNFKKDSYCWACSSVVGGNYYKDDITKATYSRTLSITTKFASGKKCDPSLVSQSALGDLLFGESYFPSGWGKKPASAEECGQWASMYKAIYFQMGQDGKCYTCGKGEFPLRDGPGTSETSALQGVSSSAHDLYKVRGYRVVADNSECPETSTRKQAVTAASFVECMDQAFKVGFNIFDFGPDNSCNIGYISNAQNSIDLNTFPPMPSPSRTFYAIENPGQDPPPAL